MPSQPPDFFLQPTRVRAPSQVCVELSSQRKLTFEPFEHHCRCCPLYKAEMGWQALAPVSSQWDVRKNSYPHKNSNNSNIKVVQFQDKAKDKESFEITDHPQEVWPFLETGRT
jgi:hypothetical protein